MAAVREIYAKYQKFIENILFPLVLILYPLLKINQGIDVSDTTYSLANFQYFGQMNGTWIVATFLANAAGNLLMYLPFADTLLGMNFYTALVQSLTAMTVYAALRRKIPAPLVAVGEFAALGLCWCPSVILYNYLTYLLMTAGILLLYSGILENRENRKIVYLAAAGSCLGANVAVRMPNVVQAALILAVWYGVWLDVRDRRSFFRCAVRAAGWCVLGYLIGFGIPFVIICIRYGWQAYPAMVQTMFAMTEKAVDYKPSSMLTGMFDDYVRGLYWLLFAGICMAAGWLMFGVSGRFFKEADDRSDNEGNFAQRAGTLRRLIRICYVGVFLVLLRFYWGKGMFHFRYYQYGNGSVYYPAVLLLLSALSAAVCCLVRRDVGRERKVFAVLVILEVFLTPLGSNNDLYPIINNLFLTVPFLLWIVYDRGVVQTAKRTVCAENEIQDISERRGRDSDGFVWKAPLFLLCLFVLIQSIGLHMYFVFQDGIWGEKRDTQILAPAKVEGVYTNRDNGEMLEELAVYVQTAGLSGREVLLYGEIPGLGYLLDMPSALSTFWPDLPSYRMVEFERDLAEIRSGIMAGEEMPAIILASPVAAYLSEDADAMNWFGVDREKMNEDEKLQKLRAFMEEYDYAESFGNARYVVYEGVKMNRD